MIFTGALVAQREYPWSRLSREIRHLIVLLAPAGAAYRQPGRTEPVLRALHQNTASYGPPACLPFCRVRPATVGVGPARVGGFAVVVPDDGYRLPLGESGAGGERLIEPDRGPRSVLST